MEARVDRQINPPVAVPTYLLPMPLANVAFNPLSL